MSKFDSGMNPTEIDRLFNISRSTVYDWIEVRNHRGSLKLNQRYLGLIQISSRLYPLKLMEQRGTI
jgi:DNA invertase Pin-like site-specific DNA recombinase